MSAKGERKTIRIWSGYFDDMMDQFIPSPQGWTGLAYYYHLAIGWYKESPWQITDLDETSTQLHALRLENCRFDKTQLVYDKVCGLVKEAAENGESIFIAEE